LKKKIALITGASGQDGAYLAKFLIKKNYKKIIAADRRSSRNTDWRFKSLKIYNHKCLIIEDIDLTDISSIIKIFQKYKIDEVYNLAAQSFVKSSFNTPLSSCDVTAMGVLRILEVIRLFSKKTKFYQASSSEMFGDTYNNKQNENTNFRPRSPYAISKVFGHHITKNYRESYNLFACSGILFNHESPIRGHDFVTKKIVSSLVKIKYKKQEILELGNLNAIRDWGFAGDYVEAMWKMLQQKKPEDFVIATNKTCSVKKFIEMACKIIKINIYWKGEGLNLKGIDKDTKKVIIKINKKFYRPSEVHYLRGDYNYALKKLNWKPKIKLYSLIKIMIDFEIENLNNFN
jgi:GDPmannose 4,6-dehydratase